MKKDQKLQENIPTTDKCLKLIIVAFIVGIIGIIIYLFIQNDSLQQDISHLKTKQEVFQSTLSIQNSNKDIDNIAERINGLDIILAHIQKTIAVLDEKIYSDNNFIHNLQDKYSEISKSLNSLSSQHSSTSDSIKSQTSQINSINTQIDVLNQNYSDLNSAISSLNLNKEQILQINQQIDTLKQQFSNNFKEISIFGQYLTEDWFWHFSLSSGIIGAHPTVFAKLTINKRSVVTFIVNGHISTSSSLFSFILQDKVPIQQTHASDSYRRFYSFFTTSQNSITQSMNYVQEAVIESGTFLFEVGIQSDATFRTISGDLNGLGLTIKVQEL